MLFFFFSLRILNCLKGEVSWRVDKLKEKLNLSQQNVKSMCELKQIIVDSQLSQTNLSKLRSELTTDTDIPGMSA